MLFFIRDCCNVFNKEATSELEGNFGGYLTTPLQIHYTGITAFPGRARKPRCDKNCMERQNKREPKVRHMFSYVVYMN